MSTRPTLPTAKRLDLARVRRRLPPDYKDSVADAWVAFPDRVLGDTDEAEYIERLCDFIRYFGIDPVNEPNLVQIAEDAMLAAVPSGWTEQLDSSGAVLFFNALNKKLTAQHPLDAFWEKTVLKKRANPNKSVVSPPTSPAGPTGLPSPGARSDFSLSSPHYRHDADVPAEPVSPWKAELEKAGWGAKGQRQKQVDVLAVTAGSDSPIPRVAPRTSAEFMEDARRERETDNASGSVHAQGQYNEAGPWEGRYPSAEGEGGQWQQGAEARASPWQNEGGQGREYDMYNAQGQGEGQGQEQAQWQGQSINRGGSRTGGSFSAQGRAAAEPAPLRGSSAALVDPDWGRVEGGANQLSGSGRGGSFTSRLHDMKRRLDARKDTRTEDMVTTVAAIDPIDLDQDRELHAENIIKPAPRSQSQSQRDRDREREREQEGGSLSHQGSRDKDGRWLPVQPASQRMISPSLPAHGTGNAPPTGVDVQATRRGAEAVPKSQSQSQAQQRPKDDELPPDDIRRTRARPEFIPSVLAPTTRPAPRAQPAPGPPTDVDSEAFHSGEIEPDAQHNRRDTGDGPRVSYADEAVGQWVRTSRVGGSEPPSTRRAPPDSRGGRSADRDGRGEKDRDRDRHSGERGRQALVRGGSKASLTLQADVLSNMIRSVLSSPNNLHSPRAMSAKSAISDVSSQLLSAGDGVSDEERWVLQTARQVSRQRSRHGAALQPQQVTPVLKSLADNYSSRLAQVEILLEELRGMRRRIHTKDQAIAILADSLLTLLSAIPPQEGSEVEEERSELVDALFELVRKSLRRSTNGDREIAGPRDSDSDSDRASSYYGGGAESEVEISARLKSLASTVAHNLPSHDHTHHPHRAKNREREPSADSKDPYESMRRRNQSAPASAATADRDTDRWHRPRSPSHDSEASHVDSRQPEPLSARAKRVSSEDNEIPRRGPAKLEMSLVADMVAVGAGVTCKSNLSVVTPSGSGLTTVRWFRSEAGASSTYVSLPDASGLQYIPTCDDVGSTIRAELSVQLVGASPMVVVADTASAVVLLPVLAQAIEANLSRPNLSFAVLRIVDHVQQDGWHIVLEQNKVKIKDPAHKTLKRAPAGTAVRVLLLTATPHMFMISLSTSAKPPPRSTFTFSAASRASRDEIVLTIRRYCQLQTKSKK